MLTKHIFFISDDNEFIDIINSNLESEGYLVNTSQLYENIIEILMYFKFSAILIDIFFCKNINSNKNKTIKLELDQDAKLNSIEKSFDIIKMIKESVLYEVPIIAVINTTNLKDRVLVLQNKVDDCIIKSRDLTEMLLRLDFFINLYKSKEKDPNIIKIGDFIFNIQRKTLKKDNQLIQLTSNEMNLLKLLVEENQVTSRNKIAKILNINIRSVDVQINRLRKKIEIDEKKPTFLQTIRNEGYILYI